MCDALCGSGVQVLSVSEEGRYASDEAALRLVSEQAEARALPVAVVSVAGATRGGKSFLLDFFLRYLRAPEDKRRSGAWIGAEDEPLTGFSWRGGCERDTKGILVWSEPIVVTLGDEDNSEKVAVVLMDTQGTFDSTSTVRDSSTVFAMSTLLSSVQIYNLSQNIQEDDLQYLQLFTEYGKLARDEATDKPFQELVFLVRDWSYAYEHPVGAEGGNQFLDKRLETRSEQPSELREIRSHVRSTFERVRCFLMPHPGLTVATSPTFTGCPADISSDFKNALQELVSSLFTPENLTIKRINGQTMTLQDFPEYFKTYVEIFNSDSLPTPTTIMEATSMASLEVALNAAREEYCSHMELRAESPRRRSAYVPRGSVPRVHEHALRAARDAFSARRTLAAPHSAAARLHTLLQDLDGMLPQYVTINNGRILAAIAACKAEYEEAMSSELCLSPEELETRHKSAAAAARAELEAARVAPTDDNVDDDHGDKDDDDDDEDWKTLEKELEDLLPLFRERNEERIASAVVAASECHAARVRDGCGVAPCLHPHSLRDLHRAATRDALSAFRISWLNADAAPMQYMDALATNIDLKYQEFVRENDAKNKLVIEEALVIYDNTMSETINDEEGRCLHPRDVVLEHNRSRGVALTYFHEKRDPAGRHHPYDEYERILNSKLIPRFMTFEKLNNRRNENAVKKSHDYYLTNIAPVRHGAEGMLEVFGSMDFRVFSRHTPLKQDALEMFKQTRRPGRAYDEDSHLEDLTKKIDKTYGWLVLKLAGSIGFAGLNVAFVTSMLLFRR